MPEKPTVTNGHEIDPVAVEEAADIPTRDPVDDTVGRRARRITPVRRKKKARARRTARVARTDEDNVVTRKKVKPADGQIPSWERRIREMEKSGTTPRDFIWHSPFEYKMPKHVSEHVSLLWMSDMMWKERPILEGFSYDIWQMMTPEKMEEFSLEVHTRDRTPEGVPKFGDAFLMWAPKKFVDQIKAYFKKKQISQIGRTSEEQKLEDTIKEVLAREGIMDTTKIIGSGIQEVGRPDDFYGAEKRERDEMGKAISS